MISPAKKLLDMYVVQNVLIANSTTLSIGDAVIINTAAPQSVIGAADTTGIVFGTVVAIKNGGPAGSVFLQEQTVTTPANNLTVNKISVDILVTNCITLYVADLTAPAGTTTNSEYLGYFQLSTTVGQNGYLLESSYSDTELSTSQFISYGVTPGNQSQVFGTWTKVAIA